MRTIILTAALCFTASAASNYKLEQREPVHHTFANNATLDIDLVSGDITVTADNGNNIRVEGEKVIRAETQEEMDRAKREVVLDANEKNGAAQLYANGPFRDSNSHASQNHGFHEHNDRRYGVAFNLTVHVPRAIALRLRSVNGFIKADGTSGAFDVNAVNGPITIANLAGSGHVNAINGEVSVAFRENPKADSYFKTINGAIRAHFQPGLNAILGVKTMNGAAYTDFESTLQASVPAAELRNGKQVFHTSQFRNLRIGSGGPELRFETLNGDIQIRKQ